MKLQNSAAEAYVEAIQPYLLGSMRVTVYDQGYAHARDAIDSLKDTAVLLSVVCGLCTLALLVLFGWLFLLKQRLTARIMMNLGTGRRKTLGYLLLSALLVLALSSLLGGIAGGVLSRKVTVAAYEKALAGSLGDYRFSSMATQGTAKEYSTLPESDPLSAVLTALCAGAAGMVFSALFSLLTISAFTPRKPKRQRKKKEKQS